MSLPAFSVKHRFLANMLMIISVLWGLMSYRSMPKDRFPDVSVDTIMVTTIMPGASPKEMEELITIPLEEEISKVDGIDEMTSTSMDGNSTIVLELESDVKNVFEKLTEIQNQIEKVEEFPTEAEDPIVEELKVSFETITVCILGAAPEREIKEYAEDLADELKLIPGVEVVDISGLREREIWIEADPKRLHAYGLSLGQIAATLRGRNLNLPGGTIRMGRSEFNVRTEAEYKNIEDILDTVLREDGAKGYVYLRDVATVRDTFEERRTLARLDGEPSVSLTVKKDKQSNALDVVAAVKKLVASFEPRLPAGTFVKFVNDASIDIRDRLKSLYQNLATGFLFVMLSFAFFVGLRPALMIAAGMPVAYLGTFILLKSYGYSVNILVLFSLILMVGILVDDAIVVCENVYRHIENGMSLAQATIRGTEEVFWPVVASACTMMAAFVPLLVMEGVLGKFMGIIPVVVTLTLVASLIECVIILPAHIVEWSGSPEKLRQKHAAKKRDSLAWIRSGYDRMMGPLLRHRYLVVLAMLGVTCVAVYVAAFGMDFILFGGRDLQRFSLEIEGPTGASLDETRRILGEFEEHALKVAKDSPEVQHVRTNAGFMSQGPMGGMRGTHVGQITVELVPLTERERMGQEIRDAIRAESQDVVGFRSMTIEDSRDGPPVGKAVQVRVKGDDFGKLREIAEEIKAYLSAVDGVTDVMDNFPPGKDEIRPLLDLEKIHAMRLDVRTVAAEVRGAFEGIEATTIHDGEEEVEVMVKYDAAHRSSLADVGLMYFSTPAGMIPFANIAQVERREGFAQISHHNRKRTINVLADVDEKTITSKEINERLMAKFADIESRHPGYSLGFGGEFEDTQESLSSLVRAFGLAILLIYMILGTLFHSFAQPLIVMMAIPFSFVGVVFGFYVMDEPLGMFAIVGIIALCGIVVNESLVLIDFINQRRHEGAGRWESIRDAGVVRFRPIILTSITTIVGLIPMSAGMFKVDPFLRPMTLAMTWGQSFATVLTLVIIPCVYAIFDDICILLTKRPLGHAADLEEDAAGSAGAGSAGGALPAQAQLSPGPGE